MGTEDMNHLALGIEQLSCISLDDGKSGSIRRSIQSKQSKRELMLRQMLRNYRTSWRIAELSKPKPFKKSEKYVKPPDVYESPLKPGTLNLKECPSRSDNLAKAPVLRLKVNKAMYKDLGKATARKFDKRIAESWKSFYNFYRRCEKKFKMQKQKTTSTSKTTLKSSKKPKKEKEDKLKDIEAWVSLRSLPKPEPKPDPLPPRKHAPLQKLQERAETLATPKQLPPDYIPPKEYPFPIAPAALTYEITENIKKLAKYPKWIEDLANEPPPRIPGSVERRALTAVATPRLEELAKPHIKTENSKDETEDVFVINPKALKYVATARIKELARPIER